MDNCRMLIGTERASRVRPRYCGDIGGYHGAYSHLAEKQRAKQARTNSATDT